VTPTAGTDEAVKDASDAELLGTTSGTVIVMPTAGGVGEVEETEDDGSDDVVDVSSTAGIDIDSGSEDDD
jgi:hypothetical protein